MTQKVNLENYHAGSFRKSATVESDAANTPSLSLVIMGMVKAVVSVEPSQVRIINSAPSEKNEPVVFKTANPDFKVQEVTFKPNQSGGSAATGGGGSVWQSNLPLYATFDFKRTTQKPDSLGDYRYELRLSLTTKDTQMQSGEFQFKTNHPEKPLLTAHGVVDIKK